MQVEEVKMSKAKIDSKLDFDNLSDGINYIGFVQKMQNQSSKDEKQIQYINIPQFHIRSFNEI